MGGAILLDMMSSCGEISRFLTDVHDMVERSFREPVKKN